MIRLGTRRRTWAALACVLSLSVACGEAEDRRISVVRVRPQAAPDCGAPEDAQSMVLRALGEFAASEETAQSIDLGGDGAFEVDRFPISTRMLEAEVRGFGGALRAIGRSGEFALADLVDGEEIAIFMAPLEGACETGPTQVVRVRPRLAIAGGSVLVVGGVELDGTPSLALEIYRPQAGRFEEIAGTTYGDTSPLGLEGATVTTLASGDVAIVGGAATAYQIFDVDSEEFLAPAFYREARGRHAAVALPDGRLFLAGGCAQLSARECVAGAELRTSSILDTTTGEIVQGPTLQLERVGGTAWLEGPGQVVLVGGENGSGAAVPDAERVFLDGRPSEVIAGLAGASAMAASGTIWAGLSEQAGETELALGALGPSERAASLGARGAFADSAVVMVPLEDGSIFALGENGAQRIRTLEGEAVSLASSGLAGRAGHAAMRLDDGSVLVTGGQRSNGEAAPALIFRPALLGPHSASATVSFSSLELSEGLSARDPGAVVLATEGGAHLELDLDGEAQYIIIAGPKPLNAEVQLALAVTGDASLQVYFGWQSPTEHYGVDLVPGDEPRLFRVAAGSKDTADATCTAATISPADLSSAEGIHELVVSIAAAELSIELDDTEVLRCGLDEVPAPGLLGLGATGTEAASMRLDIISLSR